MSGYLTPALSLVLLLACGDPVTTEDVDGSSDGETSTTTGGDTAGTTGQPVDPFFDIGTNQAGESASAFFTAAVAGQTFQVVKGAQGSWMFVVAARTNQLAAGTKRVDVEARLTPPDKPQFGSLKFNKRPVFPGENGNLYLMNVFMILSNDLGWDGHEADLFLTLTGENGEVLTDTQRIILVKGGEVAAGG
jgi:hypothetical protein